MTPERFHECLAILRMTKLALAEECDCSYSLVWRWGAGRRAVPERVAAWLELHVAYRKKHQAPRGWQTSSGVAACEGDGPYPGGGELK